MRAFAAIAPLLIFALVAGAAQGKVAPAPSLVHLRTLKPEDYMSSKPWNDTAFKAALAQALAPRAPLSRLYVAGPVMDALKPVDGALMAWACKAHDCSDVNAHVFLEAAANRLEVCWHDAVKDPAHDWWLAQGRPAEALAPGACNDDNSAIAAYRARRPR